jgi:hypothetical protein
MLRTYGCPQQGWHTHVTNWRGDVDLPKLPVTSRSLYVRPLSFSFSCVVVVRVMVVSSHHFAISVAVQRSGWWRLAEPLRRGVLRSIEASTACSRSHRTRVCVQTPPYVCPDWVPSASSEDGCRSPRRVASASCALSIFFFGGGGCILASVRVGLRVILLWWPCILCGVGRGARTRVLEGFAGRAQ